MENTAPLTTFCFPVPQESAQKSEVTLLREQVTAMAKLIDDRDRRNQRDEVAEAERQAKEEASKPQAFLQADMLQQRLIRLDEAARRVGHPNSERYNLILQRFTHNSSKPNVGQLIMTLLSTKEESALLEKERKFLKSTTHQTPTKAAADAPGEGAHAEGRLPPASPTAMGHPQDPYSLYHQWATMVGAQPQFSPPGRYGRRGGSYSPHRSGRGRYPHRDDSRESRDQREDKCYRCGRPGHFARDCVHKDTK